LCFFATILTTNFFHILNHNKMKTIMFQKLPLLCVMVCGLQYAVTAQTIQSVGTGNVSTLPTKSPTSGGIEGGNTIKDPTAKPPIKLKDDSKPLRLRRTAAPTTPSDDPKAIKGAKAADDTPAPSAKTSTEP
jgi:hypothetical protein